MRRLNLFLAVCLILPAASTVHAEVYTEADVYWGGYTDSGFKPYSYAEHATSALEMSATAEAGYNWAKGISQIDIIADAEYNTGRAFSLSQFTTTFEVISDGLVSFDYLLDGQMEIFLQNQLSSTISYWTRYNLSISDSVSDDSVDISETMTEYDAGTYVLPVDLTDTYLFGGTSYSAGTLIDVTLELQTYANAGYGYGTGSFVKSDFSNTLSVDNLVNLHAVPEPCTLGLFGVGLIIVGCRRSLRKKADTSCDRK